MYRDVIDALKTWKASPGRKPLVLRGARQVGKTWALKEFGRTSFDSTAYVDCYNNEQLAALFAMDFDVPRLIQGLELASGEKIDAETTLIVLDEVQEVPRALTSLKYFCEQAPQYHIAVAGSLLGVALHEGTSFPVGKVDFLDLGPMSFSEFLRASGDERYVDMLANSDHDLIGVFHQTLLDRLRKYMVVGGMPAVVDKFVSDQSLLGIRDVQQSILDAYDQDFSKHAPADLVPRLREIMRSIPAQLAKDNKRFFYSQMGPGARAKSHELAMLWLTDTGIAAKATRVNNPRLPLRAYEDQRLFKLFCLDVGLLGAMSKLPVETVLAPDDVFREFKGAMAEQFVFEEMVSQQIEPHYFSRDDSRGEIDFLVQIGRDVVPIEVKAGGNVRSSSLTSYVATHKPNLAIRLSTLPYKQQDVITNLPLYLAGQLSRFAALMLA
ncbi:MAG: ATP-binding protein [Propionibacteriaceae bacterium]|nr:ATP-binding protein [Propionibacteriaceae bacterium]